MNIKIDSVKNITIIKLSGEFNIINSSQFKEKVYPLFETETEVIALDLNDVKYIDSTGIGTLVGSLKQAKTRQKELVIFNLNSKMDDIFSNVGLKKFFKVYNLKDFQAKYSISL